MPALLATLLLAGCSHPQDSQGAAVDGRFAVETGHGVVRTYTRMLHAPGSLEPSETVVVSARVAGVIDRLAVTEGDQVAAGQTIALIEPERYRIAANAAKAGVDHATAVRDDAAAAYGRRLKLSSNGAELVNEEELASYHARAAQAQADLATAQASWERAQLDLAQTTVLAPVAGVIQARLAQSGSYAQSGTALVSLVRRDPMRLRTAVEADQAALLTIGQSVSFTVGSDPRPHSAHLCFIAAQADSASRLVPLLAVVDGPSGQLQAGDFAEATLQIGASVPQLVVPETALRPSERGFLVYVIEHDGEMVRVREREVAIANHTGDGGIALRSGITEHEEIVLRGVQALRPGCRGPGGGPRLRDDCRPMTLTELCIRRPVTAWAILIAIVLMGAAALLRIGISRLPDVDFPVISIQLTWAGASPESMEHDVVTVLEDAVSQVDGISSMTSTSRLGSGSITLELGVDRNVDSALTDVQARISQAQRLLPQDLDPPEVIKFNLEDVPILWLSVSGPLSRQQLSDATRYLVKERLQKVPGVGNIQLPGWLERNVRLWFQEDRLEAHALTMVEVLDRLQREHLELPAGRIETPTREIDVRVLGEALDLGALRQLVVGGSPDHPVRLEDVALVEDGFADSRSLSHNDGVEAMAVGVTKQRGENAVMVAKRVEAAMELIRPQLPKGISLTTNYDDTVFIAQSVHEVERELVMAMILTSAVCLLFLGSFAATLNVLLAIPMSILGTIAVLYWCGFTLNTFTLLALALVVGIVVDDAIMVQENISRHRARGMSAPDAALHGTFQIAFAALASTVAVIAIFLPVVFMQGIIGKFFLQFGIALCVAVALSYLEAVTLAPARCAQFLAIGGSGRSVLARLADAGFAHIDRRYRSVLKASLRHPLWVLLGAVLVFASSFLVLLHIPYEQSPSQDQSTLLIRLQTDTGSSLAETERQFARMERWLQGRSEVKHEFSVIGEGFGGNGVNAGITFVSLVPPRSRALSQLQFSEVVHHELSGYAGCQATVQDLSKGGFGTGRGFPIEFSLRGTDWDQLVDAAHAMLQGMRSTAPLLVERTSPAGTKTLTVSPAAVLKDIDTDYQLGKPEVAIVPDRERAQDLGIQTGDIAQAVSALVGGVKIGKFTADERRLDIRARLVGPDRSVPEALDSYRIRCASGQLVPLGSLVHLQEHSVLDSITHQDHTRAITIFANTGDDQATSDAVIKRLSKDLPSGVSVAEQGASAQAVETFVQFLITFLLGIIMAYLILAAQFNSFWHPFTVLVVLPLAIAGALFGLALFGKSINTFSVIGILLLMGIVKKNSIILVDYAERGRRSGLSPARAMFSAGMIRLRPILMTSVAIMAAAVPTALGLGAGAEARQPMAVAVLGGVALCTALSLMVVPAFYISSDRFWSWLKFRIFGKPPAAMLP